MRRYIPVLIILAVTGVMAVAPGAATTGASTAISTGGNASDKARPTDTPARESDAAQQRAQQGPPAQAGNDSEPERPEDTPAQNRSQSKDTPEQAAAADTPAAAKNTTPGEQRAERAEQQRDKKDQERGNERQAYREAREQARECRRNCEEQRATAFGKARDYLDSALAKMLERIDYIEEKSAAVRSAEQEIQNLREQIEEAQSRGELRRIARSARTVWNETEDAIQRDVQNTYKDRLGSLLNHSTTLKERLTCAVNTTGSDRAYNLLDRLERQLDRAEEAFQQSSLDRAHKRLQTVHTTARRILVEIRVSGGNLEQCLR